MSEACVFVTHQDLLKRSDMAPSRGEIASNSAEKVRNQVLAVSRPTPPQTGIRRPLSPVREYRIVTDVADSSEGSEMRTSASNQGQEPLPGSPAWPVISATSSGSSAVPPRLPPLDNDLLIMERDSQETAEGSASTPLNENEPSVPQHEMDESFTSDESQTTAIIQRNKMILLHGLSLTSLGGSLTLVSGIIVTFGAE
jgi:hypothetical protein